MYIHTKSWHYRFIKTLKEDSPKTLCGYIVTFFTGIFIYLSLILIGYSTSFLLGMTAALTGFSEYNFYYVYVTYPIIGTSMIILGLICCTLIAIFLLGIVVLSMTVAVKFSKTKYWRKVSTLTSRYCTPIHYKDKL